MKSSAVKITVLALVCALQLPAAARAGSLLFSTSQEVTYDPNVYRSRQDPQSDFLFRMTPAVRFQDEFERFHYELSYGVPLERGIKTYKKIEIDHAPRAQATYQLTNATGLFMSDRFRYAELQDDYRNQSTASEDDQSDLIQVNDPGKRTVITNALRAGVSHRFSPRLTSRWTFSHAFYDTTDPDRSDNQTFGAGSNFTYQLNARHHLVAGFGSTRQMFDSRPGFPGSTTDFYRLSLGWTWRIGERTNLSITLSPNYVMSKQDRPDPVRKAPMYPSLVVLTQPKIYYGVLDPVTGLPEDVLAPPGSTLYPVYGSCSKTSSGQQVLANCGFRVLVDDPGNAAAAFFPTSSLLPSSDLDYTNLPGGITLVQNGGGANRFDAPVTAIGLIDPDATVDAMFVQNPNSDQNSTLTLFGSASLQHRWTPAHMTAFHYSRRETTASGLGGSATVDSVSLTHNWRIDDAWSLRLRGDWVTRESLFPQNQTYLTANLDPTIDAATGIQVASALNGPGGLISVQSNRAVDTTNWLALANLRRRWTPRLVSDLRGSYVYQTSRQKSLGSSSDFDRWQVSLKFTYTFQAIRLWR